MLRVIIFAKAKAAVLLDSEDVGLPISSNAHKKGLIGPSNIKMVRLMF